MYLSDKAREIFLKASALSADQQVAFLEQACGEDNELYKEVQSLLVAETDAAQYFDSLSQKIGISAFGVDDASALVDKTIGSWRIKELLGRGGMGAVYLVERSDGAYEKSAALKMLPLGLDNERARSRFKQERQILARLDHNNIAHLLDGGVSEEGIPFFVMDFVEGLPIDEYCRTHTCSLEEKLGLVLQVGRAVQYAHQNLVIHRDLKPSNVMVQEDGDIRLLDFGIAKILESTGESAHATQAALRPVTPAFASPEMLRGEEVGVSTDVYSLGVLLYLLLSEKLPLDYDGLTGAEILAKAKTDRAPLLGTHQDLDAIIGKSLSKEARNRYQSMESFCIDLENFLTKRPVNARAQTPWYRFTRFVNRNRGSLSMATLVLLAITLTTALALFQSVEAKKQRDLARQEQQRVQATNEFFALLLEEVGEKPFTTVELLDRGASLLEKQFGVDEAFMAPVLYEVSRRYASIGETQRQISLLEQVESLAQEHGDHSMHATAMCRLAGAYQFRDPERSTNYEKKGADLYDKLNNPDITASHACLRMQSKQLLHQGEYDEALEVLSRMQTILDQHPGAATHLRGTLLNDFSYANYLSGNLDQSASYLQDTLTLLEESGRGSSYGYLQVATNLATVLSSAGRLNESLEIHENVAQKIRDSGYQQRGATRFFAAYGNTLTRISDMKRAESVFNEGIQAGEIAEDLRNTAAVRIGLSKVLLSQRRFEEAINTIEAVKTFIAKNESAEPHLKSGSMVMHAKILRTMGRLDEGRDMIDGFLAEIGYPEADSGPGLLSAMIESAAVHQALENYEYAESLVTDLITKLSAKSKAMGDGKVSVDVGRALIHRAEIRFAQQKYEAVVDDLETALPTVRGTLGDDHEETIDAVNLLESARQLLTN